MKVLVVTNDFPPRVGGINDYVAQLVRRFEPGEVTVFASTWPGSGEFDARFPQRVVRWPTKTLLPTPWVMSGVSRVVRDERPDIVLFGASVPLAFMGASIQRRFGVPYAACTHGLEVAATRFAPGRALLRRLGRSAAMLTTFRSSSRRGSRHLSSRAHVSRCCQTVLMRGRSVPAFRVN